MIQIPRSERETVDKCETLKTFKLFLKEPVMANATYDNLWQQAIEELEEQLHVEGAEDDNEGGEVKEVMN